jgi:hypothetical protein
MGDGASENFRNPGCELLPVEKARKNHFFARTRMVAEPPLISKLNRGQV